MYRHSIFCFVDTLSFNSGFYFVLYTFEEFKHFITLEMFRKGEFLKNILAALFHLIKKMNENWLCPAPKLQKSVIWAIFTVLLGCFFGIFKLDNLDPISFMEQPRYFSKLHILLSKEKRLVYMALIQQED